VQNRLGKSIAHYRQAAIVTPVRRPTTVASGQVVWSEKTPNTHTVEKVVQEAMNMIYTEGREGKKLQEMKRG
jgi:hypothetical protein